MENENREICMFFFFGWIFSGAICLMTLLIYWFGLSSNRWRFELTLLLIVDLGILGVLIISTLISIFLHRFSIVPKERLKEFNS